VDLFHYFDSFDDDDMDRLTDRAAVAPSPWQAHGMPPWPHLDPGPFHLAGDGGGDDVGALLLHGFSGSPTEVRGLGEHLASRGVTVAAPLLPGHGVDHHHLERSDRQAWRAAAHDALDALQTRCRRVVVVGQSMGGLLALELAAHREGIAGVVALAPALRPARIAWLTLLPLPLRFIHKHEARRPDLVEKERVRDVWSTSHTPLRAVPEVLRLARETAAALPRVTTPLLVVQGARDRTVRPESGRAVLDGVASVDKELVWLAGSAHIVAVDAERHMVWTRVADFIDRVARST
jgi:carboxylesterase